MCQRKCVFSVGIHNINTFTGFGIDNKGNVFELSEVSMSSPHRKVLAPSDFMSCSGLVKDKPKGYKSFPESGLLSDLGQVDWFKANPSTGFVPNKVDYVLSQDGYPFPREES
jgi:hypothetical protein